MKLLLVCMEYNYGDPTRGRSYEYYNFFESLKQMGIDVRIYDFMAELKARGREAMNANLVETIHDWRPDVALFSLYTDEIAPETVQKLKGLTKSLCFFHDDSWRVEFSMKWAKIFDWVTTPDVHGPRRYAREGLTNVIPFPFGCNEMTYVKQSDAGKLYDVSFVGSWHPFREWLLRRLKRAGLNVHAFGYGWPGGAIEQDEMIRIFNQSKVNLNLSNSASWDARYLISSPRGLVNRLRSPKTIEQLKARIFELNCCGGFQLSYYVEGLERYFTVGSEIGIYLDADDLLKKTRQFLEDEDLRTQIAEAGYLRARKDHTFQARFKEAFNRMGVVANG